MKTLTLIIVGALCIAVTFLYVDRDDDNIAYVESNRLLINYKGMKDASVVYQKKLDIWKSNIDTLNNELQSLIKQYEEEKTNMSPKEVELSKTLIETKRGQLIDYQRSIEEKAARDDQQMTKQVFDRVTAYIKAYGEEHNYKIIMAATDAGNIVYAKEGLNITDEVLEGLNKEYSEN